MKKQIYFLIILTAAGLLFSFNSKQPSAKTNSKDSASFDYIADRFADIQVLRYEVKGFEGLPLKQKELAYYLWQAGLCGRDIFYDQKYRYNLKIRKTLEDMWDPLESTCRHASLSIL